MGSARKSFCRTSKKPNVSKQKQLSLESGPGKLKERWSSHDVDLRPMDRWKRDALVSLEHDLKLGLSLTDLMSRLERPAGGFMTDIDRASVEAKEGRLNRVGRIIEILRKRSNGDYDIFLKIMRETGNETWASEVEDKAEQFKQEHANQDTLKRPSNDFVETIRSQEPKQTHQPLHTKCSTEPNPEERLEHDSVEQLEVGQPSHAKSFRPMNRWKRDALLLHARELQKQLANLLPHLKRAADGFMTTTERRSVESKGGQEEQVGEYLRILQTKGNEEYGKFVKLLNANGNETCASEIEKSAQQYKSMHRDPYVQVLKDYAEEFLQLMVSRVIAKSLTSLGIIPEDVQWEIEHAKTRYDSNGHLFTYLKESADREQVLSVLFYASQQTSYGKMANFAFRIHMQIDQGSIQSFQSEEDSEEPERRHSDSMPAEGTSYRRTFFCSYTIGRYLTAAMVIWIVFRFSAGALAYVCLPCHVSPTVNYTEYHQVCRNGKPWNWEQRNASAVTACQGIATYPFSSIKDCCSSSSIPPCLSPKEPTSGHPLCTKGIAQQRKPHEDVEPGDKVSDAGRESVDEQIHTAPSERNTSPKVEEEGKSTFEGKEKGDDGNELQYRVQKLEGELKTSEYKRWELMHDNTALQNKLKASREVEGYLHQELANLEERLLSVLKSQTELPLPARSPPRAQTQPQPPPSEPDVEVKVKELDAQVQQIKKEWSELEMKYSALQKMLNQQVDKYNHDIEVITQSLSTSNPTTNAMLKADPSMSIKRFVNMEAKNGRTPLLLAAEKGHTDLVRKLAGQYEGDIFHKLKNSRNALHLAAYRGHLPVLQYLCPIFVDRVLDREGNDETFLDIAFRLGRSVLAEFLTENYPQLEGKSGADRDSQLVSKRACHHRWWLEVANKRSDIALTLSSPMKQPAGSVEMVGEVEFRRDPKSNMMKAVSGTEWMYWRGGLERGRQVAATALRLHQLTRYHQRWLADFVQEEEEKNCKQWFAKKPTPATTGREVVALPSMPIGRQVISTVPHKNTVYVTGIATDDVPESRNIYVHPLAEGEWTTVPEAPVLKLAPNFNAPMAVIDNRITLIGGRDAKTGNITNTMSTWIEDKQEWKQLLLPMPTSRLATGVCLHDNLLLVTGGVEESAEEERKVVSTVYVYNISTGHWSSPQALELPQPLRSHNLVAFEENIYLAAGAFTFPAQVEVGEKHFNPHAWRARWSDVIEAIKRDSSKEAAADQQSSQRVESVWMPITTPPFLCTIVISSQTSLFAVGGLKDGLPQSAIYKFVDEKIDNSCNWVQVGDMSVGRYRHGVVPLETHDTVLLVAGGIVQAKPTEDEFNVKTSSVELVIL